MANALWERLARVFGKSTAADRKASERILLEADRCAAELRVRRVGVLRRGRQGRT